MKKYALAAFVLVILAIASVSCGKEPSRSEAVSPTVETVRAGAETARPPDSAALITDDKISRFIIYQREMNTVVDLALSAGADALQNDGDSEKDIVNALSKDERAQRLASVQDSALAESGLTQAEATEITRVLSPYIAGFTIGDDETKKKSHDEMRSQYGPEALAAFVRHLPELSKLQDEMLQKALGKKN